MVVASLELSKTLFKVSEWKDTDFFWIVTMTTNWHLSWYPGIELPKDINAIPAYNLGYLLRKLPHGSVAFSHAEYGKGYVNLILTGIRGADLQSSFGFEGDCIEDAATKLCIELFKQGILIK